MVISRNLVIKTRGDTDIVNITLEIEENIAGINLNVGNVIVFCAHTTCAVTIIEFEAGLIADFKATWERLVPKGMQYEHDKRWNDGNGYAHIRASMLGFSVTIPINDHKLLLGEWQQVVLVDFDNRPRERKVILQFSGD